MIEETEFTPEEIEAGRILFARPATFVMGAAKIEQLPEPDLPEIAFQSRTAAAIIVLLVILFGLNAAAIYMRKRFERRW